MASDRIRKYVAARFVEIEEHLAEIEGDASSAALEESRELRELEAELMSALAIYVYEPPNAN